MIYKFKNGRRKDRPVISREYQVLGVYDKFYSKWWLSEDDRNQWSLGADEKLMKKI